VVREQYEESQDALPIEQMEMLDKLVALVEQGRLPLEILDQVVHDTAEEIAAREMNMTGDDEEQEAILSSASSVASEINNAGAADQISFLLSVYGAEETKNLLEAEVAASTLGA